MAKSKSRSSSGTVSVSTREPNPVIKYYNETRAELRRVTWPTREETKNLTLIISAATIAMAIFLGSLDYIFQIVVAGIVGGDLIRLGIGIVLFLAGAAAFYANSQE